MFLKTKMKVGRLGKKETYLSYKNHKAIIINRMLHWHRNSTLTNEMEEFRNHLVHL